MDQFHFVKVMKIFNAAECFQVDNFISLILLTIKVDN
jgi:hypothetical protein